MSKTISQLKDKKNEIINKINNKLKTIVPLKQKLPEKLVYRVNILEDNFEITDDVMEIFLDSYPRSQKFEGDELYNDYSIDIKDNIIFITYSEREDDDDDEIDTYSIGNCCLVPRCSWGANHPSLFCSEHKSKAEYKDISEKDILNLEIINAQNFYTDVMETPEEEAPCEKIDDLSFYFDDNEIYYELILENTEE